MPTSDGFILDRYNSSRICIEPFHRGCLGPNSYDVHLGDKLKVYTLHVLDARKPNPVEIVEIPEEGLVLEPHRLYLGVTIEYTAQENDLVPYFDGKSSIGRLGIWTHVTAGNGDVGFRGNWTLEIVAVHPVRIYAGMPIGQIHWEPVVGTVLRSYDQKKDSKYVNRDMLPMESMMWKNWDEDRQSWLPEDEE